MANIITVSRILASFAILFAKTFSSMFWALYGWCGLSDMADGTVARKQGRQSDFGAKLDSVADFVFVAACLVKIAPALQLPTWLIVWVVAIVLCKATSYLPELAMHGRVIALHTTANKVAGLLVFASIPAMLFTHSALAAIPACVVATFAAIQEWHLIRINHQERPCLR